MQLVIVSGKGGTGKTTIASALAHLSKARIKIDCDVDASNLHLILKGRDIEESSFSGAKMARIDADICTRCSRCEEVCRFGAVNKYKIDELLCEGCGACLIACNFGAISLKDEITGRTKITKGDIGFLSRAEMEIGAEGSGRLVTEVRQKATKYKNDDDLVILDGSPGIGCAVMASITGCDMALIVTEPTQSGFEDFTRILSVCRYFALTPLVCINKFDINENISKEIEAFCNDEKIELVGKIPFDETIKKAINNMKPIVFYDSPAANEIKKVWSRIAGKKTLGGNLMEKIAISRDGYTVSGHFGHCEGFEVVELKGQEIYSREFLANPGHRPGFLPKYLAEKNINVIISGGMGATAQELFARNNIKVIVGARGKIDEVIKSYIDGSLKSTNSVCREHQHEGHC